MIYKYLFNAHCTTLKIDAKSAAEFSEPVH